MRAFLFSRVVQKLKKSLRAWIENLLNKVMAAEYRMVLPDEELLVAEIEKTRHLLETQRIIRRQR